MKTWVILWLTLASWSFAQSPALQDARSAIERKDYATALRIVRPLAQGGDPAAQSMLGTMYALGYGVPQSPTDALNWNRKSAAQGYPEAQYQLGTAYLLGEGAAKNNTEAVNWTRKAADQGHPDAQMNLGMMYAQGRGVRRSSLTP